MTGRRSRRVATRKDGATLAELHGRRWARVLAAQTAEEYKDRGYAVRGSSLTGFTVGDHYGEFARIDVRDIEGPFGKVVAS